LIDTNVVIPFLFPMEKSERAREILEASDNPVITSNILEEVVYVGLSLIYGCRGFRLRDELRKELNEKAKTFLERLKSFIIEFRIRFLSCPEPQDQFLDVIEAYRLLPNDAAIVAACRYHGIRKIATFDSDFDRVDFIDTIGLNR